MKRKRPLVEAIKVPWSPVPVQHISKLIAENEDMQLEVLMPTVYEEDRTRSGPPPWRISCRRVIFTTVRPGMRVLPLQLQIRYEWRHVDDIHGSITDDLIRDAHIATARVSRLRSHR